MDTRKIATEYRLAKWAEMLKERKSSGETVPEFCKRLEVSKNTYFYWQRKLREAVCTELSMQTESPAPQGWALCVQSPQSESKQITVEINSYRLTVTPDTDAELLVKVCRTLKNV
ncbi:MAG: transposase [Oscillospiraceae bacterium]|nr:transposase [Oscillospiraceae bacterium]